ncbi:MAG TPA: amidase [Bacteroidota bacterium]|nr:amidase [Bacteroidota bacterium]
MDRRKFLKAGSVGAGLAFATLGATSVLASGATAAKRSDTSGDASSLHDEFALKETTIDALQQKMERGELTSRQITDLYLKRIDALNKRGVKLNAVIELNPDARMIADQLDAERRQKKVRGPMHGIPILIKDNIDTADRMMTTAGALALSGHKAARDASIIARLREAGAVILGKTNLSEWANFRSTRSTSGWSSRGGQTKNPCVLDRNPCGSSSGSGAAVAANFCTVAVGTETDGSVIAPSSFCGIVGIKPTVGLVSRTGIIPISKTQDTAGPMARTVKDAAILLGALAGIDPADPVTLQSRDRAHTDYTKFLDPTALKGKRIGIERSFLSGHEGVVSVFKEAIELLKKQGAETIEVDLLKSTKELGDAEYQVLCYEFKDGVNAYLASANAGSIKTLADVIEFNKQHEAECMPYFKQEILEACARKGGLYMQEYQDALIKSTSARALIDSLMKEHSLDAIAGTSIGLPNCIDLVNGDYDTGFYFCPPAAMAGYPHITIPMGKVHELPIGLSMIAGAYQEPLLLALAYAYEQASLKREAPKFIPTLIV